MNNWATYKTEKSKSSIKSNRLLIIVVPLFSSLLYTISNPSLKHVWISFVCTKMLDMN